MINEIKDSSIVSSQLYVPYTDHQKQIAELEAENKRLREAFHEYGAHLEDCSKMFWEDPDLDCTCGFDAARLAIDSAK